MTIILAARWLGGCLPCLIPDLSLPWVQLFCFCLPSLA